MKRWAVGLLAVALVGGCKSGGTTAPAAGSKPTAAGAPVRQGTAPTTKPAPVTHASMAADDEVVASAGNVRVTRRQITDPLIEGHGLDMLLQVITLELTKDTARRQNVTVSPDDVDAEMRQTVRKMFNDAEQEDYERLLQQFLSQYRLTRPQLQITMETNAYLRKLVTPMLEGKITEDKLRDAFGALYGETVQVRHIQVTNLQEIAEAQRLLAAGEKFEDVARAKSRNTRTKELGGELPPFSRQMQGLPESFKETAFMLKQGEVSDPVQAEGAYHLIKLEERIPPRAVNFEDHKETVRQQLYENMLTQGMKQLRTQLTQEAIARLDIEHPVLRQQFEARRKAQEMEQADRDDVVRDMERRRPGPPDDADEPAGAGELGPAAPTPAAPVTPAPAAPTTRPAAATTRPAAAASP